MSTATPNLNLTKPAGNERPDVDVINGNMDILDAKIGAVGNTDLQSQVTTLNGGVAHLINVGASYQLVGYQSPVKAPNSQYIGSDVLLVIEDGGLTCFVITDGNLIELWHISKDS